jgi:hypothetical protein
MSITIGLGETPAAAERHAAAELRRYLYHLTGEPAETGGADATFQLGTVDGNAVLAALVDAGSLVAPTVPESYVLRTVGSTIAVLGADPRAVRYGVYRLLETYGVRFQLGRDLLPPPRPFKLSDVDIHEAPTVGRRGLLPWHDFLCGPSGYSFPDWRRYLDQLVKLRMNTLVLHNYAGGYPGRDIDEPFMEFTHDGVGYDGYLDTSVDNQRWGLATTTAETMAFRAGDLMPHDVMASDAARATREQPDARANTFAKGKTLMRQIVSYGQSIGVDVVLGTDFDLVPLPLAEAGCDPLAEATLAARVDDVVASYPMLRYLQLYYSESHRVTTEQAIAAYRFVHGYLARVAPDVTLLTGSWFQEERFGDMIAGLPDDVVLSSLLPHDLTVKPEWGAAVAAGRQAWAVPWIEVDGGLSEPQLAVRRMSERLPLLRDAGVQGVIGILWREQAVEVNVAYLAADAWQPAGTRLDPTEFYRDYATALTGEPALGGVLAEIEDAGVYGVPTTTNQFPLLPQPDGQTTPEFGTWFFSGSPRSPERAKRWADLHASLLTAGESIVDPKYRYELTYLLATTEWMRRYWQAHGEVPAAAELDDPVAAWRALGDSGFAEAIAAYAHLVRDLTGLGGLVSAAGGRWYYADPITDPTRVNEQFHIFADRILSRLDIAPPDRLRAHGTPDGAELTWTGTADGYHVYRDDVRLTAEPVTEPRYRDVFDGTATYRVTAVADKESAPSLPDTVRAGSAADGALRVIVYPAPGSAVAGEAYDVAATLLSDRADEFLAAELAYRPLGSPSWQRIPMRRNVTGRPRTFHAAIPGESVTTAGVEWFVEGTDGGAPTFAPVTGTFSVIGVPATGTAPPPVTGLTAVRDTEGVLLSWTGGDAELYRIYRGTVDPVDYLTYVSNRQTEFRDLGGGDRYTVVAVSATGVTSEPTECRTENVGAQG